LRLFRLRRLDAKTETLDVVRHAAGGRELASGQCARGDFEELHAGGGERKSVGRPTGSGNASYA